MPEDIHEDVRRRLFEAAWDVPAYPPAPERTVPRARRRAATTIGGGVLVAVLAIVVAASSFPLDSGETLGTQPRDVDDREFLVDISTGETTEISNVATMEGAAGFDVSPDGRRIAFAKDSGESRLFVADLDGSGSRPLTRGFLDVDDPAWSPNGREIAFGGLREGDTVRSIFVVNVANDRVRKLLRTSTDVRAPEWSPDGRSILYGVTVPAPPSTVGQGYFVTNNWTFQLRTVHVETGRIEKIAVGGKTGAVDGTFPAMEGIVFLWEREFVAGHPQQVDLAQLRRNEERPESLFEIPLGDQELAWSPQVSPDGATIAYIREFHGRANVFLFDMETEENRLLRAGFDATWVDDDTLLVQDGPASDS